MAVNRAWVEVLRRERIREVTQIQHELMVEYAMSGVGPGVEFSKRYAFIEPLLKKLLAETDQSAYRTTYQKAILQEKIHRLMQRKQELDRIEWIGSEEFSLFDWLKGKA